MLEKGQRTEVGGVRGTDETEARGAENLAGTQSG